MVDCLPDMHDAWVWSPELEEAGRVLHVHPASFSPSACGTKEKIRKLEVVSGIGLHLALCSHNYKLRDTASLELPGQSVP